MAGADFVHGIENPDFRDGPIVSLWCAREVLRRGEEILFMDADVLYHFSLLERLINSLHENCFLLDRAIEPGEDPVRLCIQDGKPVDFGKMVEGDFDLVGEWPGFLRLSPRIAARVADATETYIERGDSGVTYEEAVRHVLLDEPPGTFGYEDITDIPWIEIDFRAICCAPRSTSCRVSLPCPPRRAAKDSRNRPDFGWSPAAPIGGWS